MENWLINNYDWFFGGIGATIIGLIITFYFKNKEPNKGLIKQKINNNQSTNVSIVNDFGDLGVKINSELNSDDTHKSLVRILFIDDNHKEFKMVSILKKYGWINTKSTKDITDLDDPIILEANIIFVDINGVGITLFQDQGLGLASALKKRYPNKKVIIYSSETTGDRFHRALREVDDCLYKDAEPYQFINLIENFSKK